LNPGNSDLYIILGNFFFQMKKPAEAESAYLKAIDISPNEIKPYMVRPDSTTRRATRTRRLPCTKRPWRSSPMM
jgi:tetratricopeptide (TPR) repeat protein